MPRTGVDLTEEVKGVLPVANGGIGAGTLTGLAKGNGTAAFTAAAAGTDYSVPTGVETLTNKTLTSPTLNTPTVNTPTVNGYTEGVSTVTVGATQTISLASATVFVYTLTTATACTFTMPTAVAGKSFTVILKQPAAGTATTATFTSVKWNAVGAPTITATLGRADILSFFSDGTNWYGSYSQGYTY
jgi:hypothetical protein